jgi:hypothetical protein
MLFIWHHDNALSHTSLVMQQFLAEKNIPVIIQLLFFPHLALSDFWLFPTLNMCLKGICFTTMQDIKLNVMAKLWKIPKETVRQCFQQWQVPWSKCMCVQGSYFEDDWVSVAVRSTITVQYHHSGNFLTAPLYNV